MLYKHILIDLSNLYWRSVVTAIKKTMSDENDEKEFYSLSIQDTLIRIQELMHQFGTKNCKVYLLCDNPFSKINAREQIQASYKHARKNKNIPPIFYKSLDKLLEILKIYHNDFYIVRHTGCEADDLVPIVLNHIEKNDKGNVLLISADMDWARGIKTDNICWFNYIDIFDSLSFKDKYGFIATENSVKMYKCLHGDKSDCIDNGVPNLPKEILYYISENYNSLQELFSNLWTDDKIPKNWKLKIKDNEIQLKINYQLVDYLNIKESFETISYKCAEDLDKLRGWFILCDIDFENRLIDSKNTNYFFKKKTLRRHSLI